MEELEHEHHADGQDEEQGKNLDLGVAVDKARTVSAKTIMNTMAMTMASAAMITWFTMPTAVITESSENTTSMNAMVATARASPRAGLATWSGWRQRLTLLVQGKRLFELHEPLVDKVGATDEQDEVLTAYV